MGLETVEEIYNLTEDVYKPLMIKSIKSRLKGHLATKMTPEIDSIPKIRAIVRSTVLQNNMQYYENNLNSLVQIEGEQTEVFVKRIEDAFKNYVLMFQLHAGVKVDYAEKSATNLIRTSLARNAFHTDVRQSMKHATFNNLSEITSKIKEFPTTHSKNMGQNLTNATVGAIYNNEYKERRGGYKNRGRHFRGRYPYKNNYNNRGNGKFNRNRNYDKQRNKKNDGKYNRDQFKRENKNKNIRVVNKEENEEMSE